MAEFEIALDKTLKFEGGYVNDSDDKGLETYKGISRKYNPTWKGWAIVDKNKIYGGFPGVLYGIEELQDDVKWLYRHEYWNKICGDLILNQSVANKFFDSIVNPGLISIKFMQQSLKDQFNFKIDVDGVVGKNTLNAINSVGADNVHYLLGEFVLKLEDYYRNLGNHKYEKGWLNRARSV
jgi:lysozyme family protein